MRALSGARFYGALAALLFTAACAWLAAALYVPASAAAPAETAPPEIALRGILLRRETALAPWEIPTGAEDGKRLSASETGLASALFFAQGDGWEALAPEAAQPLTEARVEALLDAEPEAAPAARLVTDRRVWLAALTETATGLPAGTRCMLRLDGADEALPAVVEACEGAALLLRPEEAEPLYRLRFVQGTLRAG